MAERTKIYIIGFDETSNFLSDIYCMKKLKSLKECNIKLDAVFTKDSEKFLGVVKYCSQQEIDLVKIGSDEKYFLSVAQYSVNNQDKKNLANLISEKKVLGLNFWLRQDLDFEPHII